MLKEISSCMEKIKIHNISQGRITDHRIGINNISNGRFFKWKS